MNLSIFNSANLFDAATDLFSQLGIRLNSNTKEQLPVRDLLKQHFRETEIFNAIDRTFFIGIIDESVFRQTGLFDESYSYKDAVQHADKSYEGLMLFALELTKQPTRTEISELTRAFNRISQKMPVALLLKYNASPPSSEAVISIAISERFKYKQNWRQGEKAGKVIILRDIHTQSLHSGHERILLDLVKPVAVTNYEQLHAHWLQALDVSILNKKFFQELANWYFWAMDNVQFPDDIEKKKEIRNATNLIRLITRIIFIWFIKEKKLVPANLFRKDSLNKILKDFAIDDKSENYYKAILQNLFFGTLNQRMDDRGFVESHGGFKKGDQGVRNLYRYADKFSIEQNDIEKLFKEIPFLNGGLFDCLDKTDDETKKDYFVDGFTRRKEKQVIVPDFLFFGEEREVDLTIYYDPEAKRPIIRKVKGLVKLLDSYKFTVAENTPIEEEIALDPELLGKVFENLLASYNSETQTTARKQTGSFYTPRDIVNYMVDESLIEYLKQKCKDFPDLEPRLRDLFSYSENVNPFNEKETKILIKAINNCKMLDPACGSGAFPMGMLHKMVHILAKLDPDNSRWKAAQEEKIIGEKIKELVKDKDAIEGLSDAAVKEKARKAVDDRLKEIKEIFESENNFDDYSRKLFLIENCIYGVDIQPIAVQICKLRFFISLIIDQNKQEGKENLGIRSLPNLETKFVAANTLIGLEIPTSDLFSENNPIKALQEELKNVRHLYFNAKTREEKLQFQNRDKQLRKAMSEKIKTLLVERNEDEIAKIQADIEAANLVLQKIENEPENIEIIETINLFGEKTQKRIDKKHEKVKAQKEIIKLLEANLKTRQNAVNKDAVLHVAENIASFDPYDQNHFANWFEPEWMFGEALEEGFDIVMGNPPYVSAPKMVDVNPEGRQSITDSNRFTTLFQKWDLYIPFMELGIQLLAENGIFTMIVPYPFTNQTYAKKLRELIVNQCNLIEIVDLNGTKIFENATVSNCIPFLSKSKVAGKKSCYISQINNQKQINRSFCKSLSDLVQDENTAVWNLTTEKGEANRHHEMNILGDFCYISKGMVLNADEKTAKGEFTKDDLISETYDTIHCRKYIEAKDIERYRVKKIRYLEYNTERCPNELSRPTFRELYDKPKLMFNRLGSLMVFLDHETKFLHSDSMFSAVLWKDLKGVENKSISASVKRYSKNSRKEMELYSDQIELRYLLGVLNSKYASVLLSNLRGGDYHIYPEHLRNLPIPLISKAQQQPIIFIVDRILSEKTKTPSADTSQLEKQIDEMVFKLYELTYEEVKVVDPEFWLSKEEYEAVKVE